MFLKAGRFRRVGAADPLHRETPDVRGLSVLDGAGGHHGPRYVSLVPHLNKSICKKSRKLKLCDLFGIQAKARLLTLVIWRHRSCADVGVSACTVVRTRVDFQRDVGPRCVALMGTC